MFVSSQQSLKGTVTQGESPRKLWSSYQFSLLLLYISYNFCSENLLSNHTIFVSFSGWLTDYSGKRWEVPKEILIFISLLSAIIMYYSWFFFWDFGVQSITLYLLSHFIHSQHDNLLILRVVIYLPLLGGKGLNCCGYS